MSSSSTLRRRPRRALPLTGALVCLAVVLGPSSLAAQDRTGAASPLVLPDTIPIFPLPDLSLLPNTTQAFHIFEPRYRDLVEDALAGDSIIGMATLQPGFEDDYDGRPAVYRLGCAGVIVSAARLPDGRYDILLRGLEKFEIVSEDQSRSYRLAEIDSRPEAAAPDAEELEQRRRQLEDAVRAAYPQAPLPPASFSAEEAIDGLAIALPLGAESRQALLEADGPVERAAMLVELVSVAVQVSR